MCVVTFSHSTLKSNTETIQRRLPVMSEIMLLGSIRVSHSATVTMEKVRRWTKAFLFVVSLIWLPDTISKSPNPAASCIQPAPSARPCADMEEKTRLISAISFGKIKSHVKSPEFWMFNKLLGFSIWENLSVYTHPLSLYHDLLLFSI